MNNLVHTEIMNNLGNLYRWDTTCVDKMGRN